MADESLYTARTDERQRALLEESKRLCLRLDRWTTEQAAPDSPVGNAGTPAPAPWDAGLSKLERVRAHAYRRHGRRLKEARRAVR